MKFIWDRRGDTIVVDQLEELALGERYLFLEGGYFDLVVAIFHMRGLFVIHGLFRFICLYNYILIFEEVMVDQVRELLSSSLVSSMD